MSQYKGKHQDSHTRQVIIVLVIFLCALLFITRLFFLQIINDSYKDNADSNAFLKKTIYPARGLIYDRNNNLVVSYFNYSIIQYITIESYDSKRFALELSTARRTVF